MLCAARQHETFYGVAVPNGYLCTAIWACLLCSCVRMLQDRCLCGRPESLCQPVQAWPQTKPPSCRPYCMMHSVTIPSQVQCGPLPYLQLHLPHNPLPHSHHRILPKTHVIRTVDFQHLHSHGIIIVATHIHSFIAAPT
jgi:hypothetical protein